MEQFVDAIAQLLQDYYSGISIFSHRPAASGDISRTLLLKTSSGSFFVKYNQKDRFPGMYESEMTGLNLLRHSVQGLAIPRPIVVNTFQDLSFIVMEYLTPGNPDSVYWNNFGIGLANLHRVSSSAFGLDHNNYMGSLPQSNQCWNHWKDFYCNERIIPQAKLAFDHNLIDKNLLGNIERFCSSVPELMPEEIPALIHGDLWAGNCMPTLLSGAAIYDPACSYAHREADLAMTCLFGRFPEQFYHAYHESFPLAGGWEKRIDYFNLYPLLIHLNIFGQSYLSSVKSIIAPF